MERIFLCPIETVGSPILRLHFAYGTAMLYG